MKILERILNFRKSKNSDSQNENNADENFIVDMGDDWLVKPPVIETTQPVKKGASSSEDKVIQEKKVLNYLMLHGSITESIAREVLKMRRAAPRIHSLRAKGYNIKTEIIDHICYYQYIKPEQI